jgi:hypothetical protein
MRTIKWTLLPRFNIIGPVVSGKRLKCKSLRTTGRDGKLCPLTLPNIKDGFSLVEKLEIFENLLQNH